MRKIIVVVDASGDSKVEAFGFSGGDCLAATKSIEEALGKAGKRTMKSSQELANEKLKVTQ